MTKENLKTAIEKHIKYTRKVYHQIPKELEFSKKWAKENYQLAKKLLKFN